MTIINEVWLYWGIAGLVLLVAEMLTATFYLLWFGIAALILAVITSLITIPCEAQTFLFTILSVVSLYIWKKYYKSTTPNLLVGQSVGEGIGRVGLISVETSKNTNGKITFSEGFMGSREWITISNDNLVVGTEAEVIGVEGNSLRVKKHQKL